MTDKETLAIRQEALTMAKTFVQPIFESHPPEAYRTTIGPSVVFAVPAGTTVTPAEQVVDLTISIADWLLDVDQNR